MTACVAFRAPGVEPEPQDTLSWLVNPGAPISAEAAKIHGITDEIAARDGQDAAAAVSRIRDAVKHAVTGAPLVVFNAPFDITILDRECIRHDLPPPDWSGALIVDPLVLDKHVDRYRKGSRKLAAQCEHYRVALDGAHDAEADALAAMRLAWRIGQRYPGVGGMAGRELMALQKRAYAGQMRGLEEYFRRSGNPQRCNPNWPLIPRAAAVSTS